MAGARSSSHRDPEAGDRGRTGVFAALLLTTMRIREFPSVMCTSRARQLLGRVVEAHEPTGDEQAPVCDEAYRKHRPACSRLVPATDAGRSQPGDELRALRRRWMIAPARGPSPRSRRPSWPKRRASSTRWNRLATGRSRPQGPTSHVRPHAKPKASCVRLSEVDARSGGGARDRKASLNLVPLYQPSVLVAKRASTPLHDDVEVTTSYSHDSIVASRRIQ